MKLKSLRNHLRDGATKEDAALWRTLTPINLMKAALSCSRTYLTVVPENQYANLEYRMIAQ